eukprot:249266-Prymnesium_polylepis.1
MPPIGAAGGWARGPVLMERSKPEPLALPCLRVLDAGVVGLWGFMAVLAIVRMNYSEAEKRLEKALHADVFVHREASFGFVKQALSSTHDGAAPVVEAVPSDGARVAVAGSKDTDDADDAPIPGIPPPPPPPKS